MELQLDPDKFGEIQRIFIREVIQTIKIKLMEAGLEGTELEDLTASLSLSLASIIDDTTEIESDGKEAHPYLTFRTDENELTHFGENSYTYEMVFPILKSLFKH